MARVKRTPGQDRQEGLDGQERLDGQDGQDGPPPFFAALEHWYLQTAATLGRRTAELHLTLAEATEPPFVPEPLDRIALERAAGDMLVLAKATLDLLARHASTLNDVAREHADASLAHRDDL